MTHPTSESDGLADSVSDPIGEAPFRQSAPLVAAASREAWRWLGMVLTVAMTFALVRLAVLNVFYTFGDMHDPGWFASVTWHNGWHLHGPAAFRGPFFSEHLVPMFWLTNAVSYLLPLSKFDYYAGLIALIHALYAAGVYRAWQLTEPRSTAVRAAGAVLVALAATFSAVAVVALGLPHTETAIPALALWVMIALAQKHYRGAACWLAACLAVREDAGLHVGLLLILWAAVLVWQRRGARREIRMLLGFAAAAFCYSVLAFLVKRVYFPAGDILYRSYLGQPPFAHLNWAFLARRARFYLLARSYVTLPALLTVVWAGLSRNPLLPLGYLATLPWLLLSLIAVHDTPGTLAYYYGFPFWLALGWPLVALFVWREHAPAGADRRHTARWPFAALLLVSLVGWRADGQLTIFPLQRDGFGYSPFLWHDTLRDRARYQAFADYFEANRKLFGATALDEAVFSFVMDREDRASWLETWPADRPPDTMIYFVGALEFRSHVLPLLRTGRYRCIYGVPDTRIQLATRAPISDALPMPLPFIPIAGTASAGC